jgi:membrane-associated protease RseP (regulator of RpoE activity)
MKKHILLSVLLGCLITTYLFPQSENPQPKQDEAETEVIIEKIIIDEDGSETRYIIKKKGGDIISDADVKKHIRIEMDHDANHELDDLKELLFMHGIKDCDIDLEMDGNHNFPKFKRHRFPHKPKARIGVLLEPDVNGLSIKEVFPGSAAEKADLRVGDVISTADGRTVKEMDILFDVLKQKQPMDKINLTIIREGKIKKKNVVLGGNKTFLGPNFLLEKPCLGGMFSSSDKIEVQHVFEGSGAEKAGLQSGDVIIAIDGESLDRFSNFHDNILSHNPGDEVEIQLIRDDKSMNIDATIGIWKDNKVCVLPYKMKEQQKNKSPLESWTSENLEVYPIPARDRINLSFQATPGVPVEISMHDVSGKRIFSEEITDFEGHIKRDYSLEHASPGLAMIRIQQGEQVLNRQILIQ